MTNRLGRLFLCVAIILSLNVQSQDLVYAFAVTPRVGDGIGVIPGPSIQSRVLDHNERGLKIPILSSFLGPLIKSSNGPVVELAGFEKKYRKRVAMIKSLGDNIHKGVNEFADYLLLFVGQNSRSIFSVKNVGEMKTLGDRAVTITSIASTLAKDLMMDARTLFRTFTSKPLTIIKVVLSQVLKALPLPDWTLNLINNTVNKII